MKLFWYDGGKRPDKELIDGKPMVGQRLRSSIGEKGKLYAPGDYCRKRD